MKQNIKNAACIDFDDLKNGEIYYRVHKNFSLDKPVQKILMGKYYDKYSPSSYSVDLTGPDTKQCYDMEEKANYYADREDIYFGTREEAREVAVEMLHKKIEELEREKEYE